MPPKDVNRPTDHLIEPEDDLHTVADMSGIERRSVLFPARRLFHGGQQASTPKREVPEWEKHRMSRHERKYYLLGAMCAGLVIGLIFAAGLALVIFLFLIPSL